MHREENNQRAWEDHEAREKARQSVFKGYESCGYSDWQIKLVERARMAESRARYSQGDRYRLGGYA